jgi:hypothetical protein
MAGRGVRAASTSERLYHRLLWVYPAAYRREYGPLMAQLFRDLLRDARRSPRPLGLARLWLSTVFEVFVTAAREHYAEMRSQLMNATPEHTSRFSPAAGRGLLAAAIVIALGLIAKIAILETGGSVYLATIIALVANVLAALIMEATVRTGGLVLLGAGLVIGTVLLPLLWVGDPQAWLRENPIYVFIVVLTAAWSTQGRPRWPILAVAAILSAAQLVTAFI